MTYARLHRRSPRSSGQRRSVDSMNVLLAEIGMGTVGFDGSRRYARELTAGLRSVGNPPVVSILGDPETSMSWRRRLKLAKWAIVGRPALAIDAGGQDASVVHFPENVIVPNVECRPVVVTVHDVAALKRPELVGRRVAFLTRASWRRARGWDRVISPSVATANDLLTLGWAENQIRIIRHGLSDRLAQAPTEAARLKARKMTTGDAYVLVVSPFSRKKGADTVLHAWQLISSPDQGRLVWISSRGRPPKTVPAGITLLGHVDDETLVALYAGANAVVCASRFEGYGFPIAEALVQGTPVIASDIPAHREFNSSNVDLVPVEDTVTFAEAMEAAVVGGVGRRGQTVSFPTWKSNAEAHLEVYEELAPE
jgi:glycosyltransferase involved in cell wall biosynthesis